MTNLQTSLSLRRSAGLVAKAKWALEHLLTELPTGATHDTVETAVRHLTQQGDELEREAQFLSRAARLD